MSSSTAASNDASSSSSNKPFDHLFVSSSFRLLALCPVFRSVHGACIKSWNSGHFLFGEETRPFASPGVLMGLVCHCWYAWMKMNSLFLVEFWWWWWSSRLLYHSWLSLSNPKEALELPLLKNVALIIGHTWTLWWACWWVRHSFKWTRLGLFFRSSPRMPPRLVGGFFLTIA